MFYSDSRRIGSGVSFVVALLALSVFAMPDADAAGSRIPTTLVYPPFNHDLGMHHVNSTHLRIITGNNHRFINPQGVAAVKLRERDDPKKTSDDDELTVFGVNSGEHTIIFNKSMTALASFGEKGSGPGRFLNPRGIAADPEGNVYVADTGNHRIVHLRYSRGELRQLREFLRPPRGKPFRSPRGVALGSDGAIYITDYGNDRLVVLERNGALRTIMEGPDLFRRPDAIAVIDKGERWSRQPVEFLVVADRNGSRIHMLSLDGQPIESIAREDLGLPDGRFRGLAIDYNHQIYVTDEARHQIHKLDSRLELITSFGEEGKGDAQFQSPRGITLWRRFGQFFISEQDGAQYYWVGVDLTDYHAEPIGTRQARRIVFTTTERARVTIDIHDERGDLVHTVRSDRIYRAGRQRVTWFGRNAAGEDVPPGMYEVRIRARATYSSRKFFEKKVAFPIRLG